MLKKKLAYNIGIVGSTGLIGQTLLKLLEVSKIPISNLFLFASKKSSGKKIKFKDDCLIVKELTNDDCDKLDIIFFTAPSAISQKHIPKLIEKDVLIIDNSCYYRMFEGIPLVVPSINFPKKLYSKLITNPNCSTIQAVIPLSIIQKQVGIKKIVYSTYQATSGSGYKGLRDLEKHQNDFYPYPIWKTCIPEIGEEAIDNFTSEEIKMINETKKILNLSKTKIYATCVRVPIDIGHGVSIYVETKRKINYQKLLSALKKHPDIVIKDDLKKHLYPTSLDTYNNDLVYLGRIRRTDSKALMFYVTANNIRVGAASNALKILEHYLESL